MLARRASRRECGKRGWSTQPTRRAAGTVGTQMTNFDIDMVGWKPVLAIVAAHGATDSGTLDWVPHYATWLLLPLPSSFCVTALFCVASLVHFCDDGGKLVSFFVHASVALVGVHGGADVAFKVMLTYLLLWHLPLHYRRHWRARRRRGLLVAAAATAAGLSVCRRLPDRVPLGDWMQRIVIAHVSHERTLER